MQVVLFNYETNVLICDIDFWGCWKNFAGQVRSGKMSGPLAFWITFKAFQILP